MENMGQWWTVLSIGTLLVLVLVLVVCVQTLRVQELQKALSRYSEAWDLLRLDRDAQANQMRNYHSGLRAEKAHVAQLQRKVQLLQVLIDSNTCAAQG